MNCLKCGKKTADEQSFCSQCLEIMEAYPVRSDVPVQLPSRTVRPQSKRPPRKRLSSEDQLGVLRKRNRRLAVLAGFLAILLLIAGAALVYTLTKGADLELGKNYTFGIPLD